MDVTIYEIANNYPWPKEKALKKAEFEELGLKDTLQPISTLNIKDNPFILGYLKEKTMLSFANNKKNRKTYYPLDLKYLDEVKEILATLIKALELVVHYPFTRLGYETVCSDFYNQNIILSKEDIFSFRKKEIRTERVGNDFVTLTVRDVLRDEFSSSFNFLDSQGRVNYSLIECMYKSYFILKEIVDNNQKIYLYVD